MTAIAIELSLILFPRPLLSWPTLLRDPWTPDVEALVSEPNRYEEVTVESDMGFETDRANAHLLAASCDLLSACRDLLAASERHIFSTECLVEREAARAAIAKAEGRES